MCIRDRSRDNSRRCMFLVQRKRVERDRRRQELYDLLEDAALQLEEDRLAYQPSGLGGISPSTSSSYQPLQTGGGEAVSYTHLRAHETPEHLVCRLLLEKKKKHKKPHHNNSYPFQLR
eukprot:TRINITY_DN33858_c0_g1_i1.p1 TRINITY_DN33858_c0_g1~~TRINITY_DN33858_c0_g1_i1.p1  ORF type:complete len:118 (-),score=34.35 TRINITY_DN33858_c0_g1_i1:28-381(-)